MSNIITIETDIEPPLVAVAMSDWNALNRAYEAALARAEAAEKRVAELEARLAEQDEYNPEDDPIWQQADAAYERVTRLFTPPPAATE